MDETDRPDIGDPLSALLLRKKHNVCGVEPMEVVGVEISEKGDHPHDVIFYNVPTSFEE